MEKKELTDIEKLFVYYQKANQPYLVRKYVKNGECFTSVHPIDRYTDKVFTFIQHHFNKDGVIIE